MNPLATFLAGSTATAAPSARSAPSPEEGLGRTVPAGDHLAQKRCEAAQTWARAGTPPSEQRSPPSKRPSRERSGAFQGRRAGELEDRRQCQGAPGEGLGGNGALLGRPARFQGLLVYGTLLKGRSSVEADPARTLSCSTARIKSSPDRLCTPELLHSKQDIAAAVLEWNAYRPRITFRPRRLYVQIHFARSGTLVAAVR
jgi:hypothetical protein